MVSASTHGTEQSTSAKLIAPPRPTAAACLGWAPLPVVCPTKTTPKMTPRDGARYSLPHRVHGAPIRPLTDTPVPETEFPDPYNLGTALLVLRMQDTQDRHEKTR